MQVFANDGRIVGQGRIQDGHHGRVCALLRSEDGRGSFGAGQGVGHIRGQTNAGAGQAGIQSGDVNPVQPGQCCSSLGQFISFSIQQPGAQGLGHAGAAVVGGRAAEADDDLLCALVQGLADQLARAIGGGHQWVAGLLIDELDAAGCSHLDGRCTAIAQNAVASGDGQAQRPGGPGLDHAASGGIDQGLDRALAAIGHGHKDHFGLQGALSQSAFYSVCGLLGGQAALEGVGCNDDFHGCDLS